MSSKRIYEGTSSSGNRHEGTRSSTSQAGVIARILGFLALVTGTAITVVAIRTINRTKP